MADERGKPNWYRDACKVIDVLVRNAAQIGLELIIDYQPRPWGRSWKCDRGRWLAYNHRVVNSAPGGDWFHIEISPDLAQNPKGMISALDKAFSPVPPQP